ncbi:MAG: hypothetical protein Q7Q71_16420 [Verrucomicrobiota bacterium JB023]|nr:hypothetical protein [Verrucomicrobiota bacterium JB023]
MKGTIVSLLLMASVPFASARTWTSADGEKTFEGELQKYDAVTDKVTVLTNGRSLTFATDMLSEADVAYVKEWKPVEESDPEAELEAQKVGKNLTSRVLSRLDGKRFKKASMEKAPEYYLLYFSASW